MHNGHDVGRDNGVDSALTGAQRVGKLMIIPAQVAIETQEKITVRRFLVEVIGEGDLSVADQLVATDCVFRHSDRDEPLQGLAEARAFFATFHQAFPDLRMTITHMLAEDNQVACRVVCEGTNTGPILGVSPTHKRAVWTATNFIRMADGKIKENVVTEDTYGMLRQLGLITVLAGQVRGQRAA